MGKYTKANKEMKNIMDELVEDLGVKKDSKTGYVTGGHFFKIKLPKPKKPAKIKLAKLKLKPLKKVF